MRTLVIVIASPGEAYDAMKHAWLRHWERGRADLAPGSALVFAYGRGGLEATAAPSEHDVEAPGVEESVVPGVMRKTLLVLERALQLNAFDAFVRTNLSSVYAWDALAAFVRRLGPGGDADASGFSDDFSHLSGCNLGLSRAAARLLVSRRAELAASRALDDVAASDVLLSSFSPSRVAWVARVDLLPAPFPKNCGGGREPFHVRVKSADRGRDAATMLRLVDAYAAGGGGRMLAEALAAAA